MKSHLSEERAAETSRYAEIVKRQGGPRERRVHDVPLCCAAVSDADAKGCNTRAGRHTSAQRATARPGRRGTFLAQHLRRAARPLERTDD